MKTAQDRNPGDPDARTVVERTIRVDQAGEFGAVRIYEGQLAALRWTGRGRSEASRKIAAMAETYGIGVAPHNPVGTVGTAVAAQLAFALPNFVILESFDARQEFVLQDLDRTDGGFLPPTAPGLGVTVDEAWLSKFRCVG